MLRGETEGISGRTEDQGAEIERQGTRCRQTAGRKDKYHQFVFHDAIKCGEVCKTGMSPTGGSNNLELCTGKVAVPCIRPGDFFDLYIQPAGIRYRSLILVKQQDGGCA